MGVHVVNDILSRRSQLQYPTTCEGWRLWRLWRRLLLLSLLRCLPCCMVMVGRGTFRAACPSAAAASGGSSPPPPALGPVSVLPSCSHAVEQVRYFRPVAFVAIVLGIERKDVGSWKPVERAKLVLLRAVYARRPGVRNRSVAWELVKHGGLAAMVCKEFD
jgi:hypothetical protein